MTSPSPSSPDAPKSLTADSLRWRCSENEFPFESTQDVTPIEGVVAQDHAVESMKFGLEIDAPGQNIFVRGLAGTGRLTMIHKLVKEIQPACPLGEDVCYVPNFAQPDAPRKIMLPRGRGRDFEKRLSELLRFIGHDLLQGLGDAAQQDKRKELEQELRQRVEALLSPLNQKLSADELVLVNIEQGRAVIPGLLPVIDGKPISVEEFQKRRAENTLSDAQAQEIIKKIESHQGKVQEVTEKIGQLQHEHIENVKRIFEQQIRDGVKTMVAAIESAFPLDPVREFLGQLIDAVITIPPDALAKNPDALQSFRVHTLIHHQGDQCPIVVENSPTVANLLGSVDLEVRDSKVVSDHTMIRAGSVLRASGGYLILEARDLMTEPGAWNSLVKILRTGSTAPIPATHPGSVQGPILQPEPVPVNVKVILLGDSSLYYYLDAKDPDFPELFKVLCDFESEIPRDERARIYYAGVVARLIQEENLLAFHRSAIAALMEHGARIASRKDRVTARFGRLADIVREATFLARKANDERVHDHHIREAVERTKVRAGSPIRRISEQIRDGALRIATSGSAIGQVNGLAVIKAGPLSYGFPSRITASIGPGTAGAINIEREADLSGAIHTKGFYILGGLLRHLLHTEHPLAFSASIAFEQSYGGIDGDSASGAEMCCLLSEITGVPIRQDLAMTGAIDQKGNILPIGAVNEKIEGFYSACKQFPLTGTQGVIIPRANAGELMLRHEIVEAAESGQFSVYPVDSIIEAMKLFSGRDVDSRDESGNYTSDSILGIAVKKAREYWDMSQRVPCSNPT